METLESQFVVVGAGAVGAAVAYHLSLMGHQVTLLEQFALGHNRGSSHGAARITRHSYANPVYARLMPAAFRAWRELEADVGNSFYIRTGGVSFCPPEVDYVARVADNLASIDVPHQRMSGLAWNRHNPLFSIPDRCDVVFEPDAGMLLAGRALNAMIVRAGERGCRVLQTTIVERIEAGPSGLTLICRNSQSGSKSASKALRIEAKQVVVAAGAWVGHLIPELKPHLRPTLQQVRYLRPLAEGATEIGKMPVFIYQDRHGNDSFYGMPAFPGSGVKVARHGGPDLDPGVDERVPADDIEAVRLFLRTNLHALCDADIIASELCVYTMQQHERFVAGPVARAPGLWVASACSGHGFKFSCFVGKTMADWASTGGNPSPAEAWLRPDRLAIETD
jgi:sarcosine oxidase